MEHFHEPCKARADMEDERITLKEAYDRADSELNRFEGDEKSQKFQELLQKRRYLVNDINALTKQIKQLAEIDDDEETRQKLDEEYEKHMKLVDDLEKKVKSVDDGELKEVEVKPTFDEDGKLEGFTKVEDEKQSDIDTFIDSCDEMEIEVELEFDSNEFDVEKNNSNPQDKQDVDDLLSELGLD